MNIYLITDEEFFCIAHELAPSLAKRLCKQYNKQFSGATLGSSKSPKKLLGNVDTRLQCIVGYFLSEECLDGISIEDAIKHLNKYIRTI